MNDSVINNLPAHWPMYGLLLIVASIAIWATVKVLFSAKASSREKAKEWNLSGRLDADGIPLLADDLRRPGGGFSYPTQTNRRSSR
jgi:hypothetical protein